MQRFTFAQTGLRRFALYPALGLLVAGVVTLAGGALFPRTALADDLPILTSEPVYQPLDVCTADGSQCTTLQLPNGSTLRETLPVTPVPQTTQSVCMSDGSCTEIARPSVGEPKG